MACPWRGERMIIIAKQDFRYSLLTLNFDITRRCNMACPFCARGDAQNKDITPEVIDATFDNVRGVYICDIRLSGGEPMLNPDMVSYTIDSMIRHNAIVNSIFIFTNATVYGNPKIDAALIRAAEYLEKIDATSKWPEYHKTHESPYNVDGKIKIILSDYRHDNADHISMAYQHYNNLNHKIKAVKQTEALIEGEQSARAVLYGRAIDNAATLFEQPITLENVAPINENKYNIIVDKLLFYPPEPPYVIKSITISTDGTVFLGCMKSYRDVDAEAEFNIMDGDLFDYLREYCWRYPATKGMQSIRRVLKALKLCKEIGLSTDFDETSVDGCLKLIQAYEDHHRDLHRQYPYLPHPFISIRCLIDLYAYLEEKGFETGYFFDLSDGYEDDEREALLTKEGRRELAAKYDDIIQDAPAIILENYRQYIGNEIKNATQSLTDIIIGKPTNAADIRRAAVHEAINAREAEKRRRIDEHRAAQGLEPINWPAL